MFNKDWRNGLATGLILAITIGATLILLGEHLYKLVNCITQTECKEYAIANESNNEPEWWYWARRFFTTEDTLAQWIMSIFSIGAVVLLWRTLVAANKTNSAAVKATEAANAANKIMLVGQRPWVTIQRDSIICKLKLIDGDKYSANWDYQFKNMGKSPAINVKFEWGIYRYDWRYIGAGRVLLT